MRHAVSVLASVLAAMVSLAANAQVAPTGAISPTTLKLPDGPGSIVGLAEPADVDLFTGQVQYAVPIQVPAVAGVAPSISLSYSGALGNGPMGIGWSLGIAAIRRTLREGVPNYDDEDELTIEGLGSGRLLTTDSVSYWVEGSGDSILVRRIADRFEATDGNGTRYVFGRNFTGRLQDGERTAAWFVQEVVGLTGERMTFEYTRDRGAIYLRRVKWGPRDVYQVEVELERRVDEVSSFATGFPVTTGLRVLSVRVRSFGEELRRYRLEYDASGAVSRLVAIHMTGRGGHGELPSLRFGYATPAAPLTWQVDAGGWVLGERGVVMLDMDGDGADDLLRLEPGATAWRKNIGGRFGSAEPVTGANAVAASETRFLDTDGDARPELVRLVDDEWRAYQIVNNGFASGRPLLGTRGVALHKAGRVLADVDGDGRTDVIEAITGGMRLRRGTPAGLAPPRTMGPVSKADPGVAPGAPGVRFVDANGDSLVDVLWLTESWIKVYLGRGDGAFVAFAKMFYPWGNGALDPSNLHLVDLDRDGLIDLVRIDAGKVRWFQGFAGFRFAELPRQLDRPQGVGAEVKIDFADINADGTEELIWSTLSGMWALDLAGSTTRAMLATIDDGFGQVTQFAYQASARMSLTDGAAGRPWARELPRSIAVVTRREARFADGTPSRIVTYGVRDGAWDGAERRFAGFLATRRVQEGDTAALTLVEKTSYDPGLSDRRVLRGRAVREEVEDGLGRLFSVTELTWEALAIQGLSDHPLWRRAALLARRVTHHDPGALPIQTLLEIRYDAKARPVLERHHGRIDLDGDEYVVEKRHASHSTFGVSDRLCDEKILAWDGRVMSHSRFYFGDHASEHPHCDAGRGWPRRHESLLIEADGTQRWVTRREDRYDARGNVVEAIEGKVRRRFEYDDDDLFPLRESLVSDDGKELVWSATWDAVLGEKRRVTEPTGDYSEVDYDDLGRPLALSRNGLPAHERYAYEWVGPRPRTRTYTFDGYPDTLSAHAASFAAGPPWRESVSVVNAAGESLYRAVRVNPTRWSVSAWTSRDSRGQAVAVLDAFYHDSDSLPEVAQQAVPEWTSTYDALGRTIVARLPTGSRTHVSHSSFSRTVTADDRAPVKTELDGLGRVIRTQRGVGGVVESVDASYDAAGRIVSLRLQGGQVSHEFTYDTLGRLIHARDPDIGPRTMRYDDADGLTSHVNGAGQTLSMFYDGFGRLSRRVADDGTSTEFHYDRSFSGETTRFVGRLAWVAEPTGRVEQGYDDRGRANFIRRTISGVSATETRVISPSGLVLSEQHDDGLAVTSAHDSAGRLVRLDGASRVLWEALEVDAAGRILRERSGNGVLTDRELDAAGSPRRVHVRRSDQGDALLDLIFARNGYGAIVEAEDRDGHGLDHAARFTYDEGGRLTTAILGATPAPGDVDHRYRFGYSYDGLQNMLGRTANGPRPVGGYAGGYRYGENGAGPRQLTSVVSAGTDGTDMGASPPVIAAFAYDGAGRQVADGTTRMTYDGLDALVSVELMGGVRMEYAYGYDGQRVLSRSSLGEIERWFWSTLREVGGKREHYVKVGERFVAKVVMSQPAEAPASPDAGLLLFVILGGTAFTLGVLAVRGARATRSLRPLFASGLVLVLVTPGCAGLGMTRATVWTTTEVVYFSAGANPGPAIITAENGRVIEERRHEPFGQSLDVHREGQGAGNSSDTADHGLEPLGALNKPVDPSTGWSYHGARWMASQTARWLTPDAPVKGPAPRFLLEPWALHPYQYVLQNPLASWDPDGQDDRCHCNHHEAKPKDYLADDRFSAPSGIHGTVISPLEGWDSGTVLDYVAITNLGIPSVVSIPVPGTKLFLELKPRGFVPSSGSTSSVFIQSADGRVHLRLDYGYNKATGQVDYHWNQKGTYDWSGIRNHTPAGAKGKALYKAAKAFKYGGKVLVVVGLAADAYSIYEAKNRPKQIAKVVGGLAGAVVGAKLGGAGGAAGGTVIEPGFGTAVGGFLGGMAGAIGGAIVGAEITETIWEEVFEEAEETSVPEDFVHSEE